MDVIRVPFTARPSKGWIGSGYASGVSSAATGPGAGSSPARKLTIGVLIAGGVAAAALAVGTVWIVRGGVALAVLTAIASVLLAWREARIERREAAVRDLQLAREQGIALSRERRSNIAVVNSLESSNSAIAERVDDLGAEIRSLRSEIAMLRKLKGELAHDIAERDNEVVGLRRELTKAQAELHKLLADEADVYAISRHGSYGEDSSPEWAAVPTAEELWTDGDHPTVVDMKALIFPDVADRVDDQRKHA